MLQTATQVRLFMTCWIVFSLHFATDFVREHFLVHSMIDSRTFDLGDYYGMHPDIFRNPPEATVSGTHHGANPGMSMVGAIPYLVLKPLADLVVRRELASRDASAPPAEYRDARPRRVAFYKRARELGVDVRFALISLITMVLCMGPLSALSAVVVMRLTVRMGMSERLSMWLALAYAFCTPTMFRTAFLNQNIGIGLFSIFAFSLLWDSSPTSTRLGTLRWRYAVAGLLGGLCFLSDYSGALALGLLGLYGLWRATDRHDWKTSIELSAWFTAGAVPMIAALWYYQWAAFGHAFYPPQHWMPPVEWIEVGYQGVGGPQLDLLWLLLADTRYGLFTSAPLLLLAVVWPLYARRGQTLLPRREALLCAVYALTFLFFFSSVQYTRLQWVTGIRYVMPIVPFLFLMAADVVRLVPRPIAWVALGSGLVVNWSLSMTRSQQGIWDAITSVLRDGPSLPSVTTLSKMTTQYLPWSAGELTVAMFALATFMVAAVWWLPLPQRPSRNVSAQRNIRSADA